MEELIYWCRRGDSNPHGLPHMPLKHACLPVPPLRQITKSFKVKRRWRGNGEKNNFLFILFSPVLPFPPFSLIFFFCSVCLNGFGQFYYNRIYTLICKFNTDIFCLFVIFKIAHPQYIYIPLFFLFNNICRITFFNQCI